MDSKITHPIEQLVDKVITPVVDAVMDALPEAVTAPLTGPMIVRVTPDHQHKLYEHLLRLPEADRYLRFGSSLNDEGLRSYAFGIDLAFDDAFAILDEGLQIAAMAHVAYKRDPQIKVAEFGVSVDPAHRGKGYALALMQRAIVHARTRDISRFFIHALAQNTPMLRLARKVGMSIEMHGSEATGNLLLPPANLSTHIGDALTDGRASVELELRKRTRWLKEQFASEEPQLSNGQDAPVEK